MVSKAKKSSQSTKNVDATNGKEQIYAESGETSKAINDVCELLRTTLVAKNKAYGNSVLNEPCLLPGLTWKTAVLVRLSDKFSRVKELASGAPENDESLDDTILDVAGYCVMYLVGKRRKN